MANSYVISAGAAGKTGSLQVVNNGSTPFFLANLKNVKIEGNDNDNAVIVEYENGKYVRFDFAEIATIGGVAPANLSAAVTAIANLVIE